MRHPITLLPLLCAACASDPTPFTDDEVFGRYETDELRLELAPRGHCTWTIFEPIGPGHVTTIPGLWKIEHDRVAIAAHPLEPSSIQASVPGPYSVTLDLRRWDGHVYLVRTDELQFFDTYGPMIGCCFAKEGAPISMGPHTPLKATRS